MANVRSYACLYHHHHCKPLLETLWTTQGPRQKTNSWLKKAVDGIIKTGKILNHTHHKLLRQLHYQAPVSTPFLIIFRTTHPHGWRTTIERVGYNNSFLPATAIAIHKEKKFREEHKRIYLWLTFRRVNNSTLLQTLTTPSQLILLHYYSCLNSNSVERASDEWATRESWELKSTCYYYAESRIIKSCHATPLEFQINNQSFPFRMNNINCFSFFPFSYTPLFTQYSSSSSSSPQSEEPTPSLSFHSVIITLPFHRIIHAYNSNYLPNIQWP